MNNIMFGAFESIELPSDLEAIFKLQTPSVILS